MTDTKMLVGSLSNDLFRVASLAQRGSTRAASRFLQEAQRWSRDLQKHDVAEYVKRWQQIFLPEKLMIFLQVLLRGT